MVHNPVVAAKLESMGLAETDVADLFTILDSDCDGIISVDEFVHGLVKLMDGMKTRDLLLTQSLLMENKTGHLRILRNS